MKNTLNYYYGLYISNIHQKNKNYYFSLDNYDYIFIKYDNEFEINDIYELSTKLNQIGILNHTIILNKSREVLTKINDDNYILLKINASKTNININDIIIFNNINYNFISPKLRRDNWYELWTTKIDYFEYQINQIGKKYPILTESFSYFVGLAENAISLIKTVDTKSIPIVLSHRRIGSDSTSYDLYNPLNFIFDLRIRDICEYFKNKFFNGINIKEELRLYFQYNKLNYIESICFLSRMLFPTYYFDYYEKIISDEYEEDKINEIISKTIEYEMILREIYIYLKSINNIPDIDWLKKVIQY